MNNPTKMHLDYERYPQHRFLGGSLQTLLNILVQQARAEGEAWRVLTSGAFVRVEFDSTRTNYHIVIARNGSPTREGWQDRWKAEVKTFAAKFRLPMWEQEYVYEEKSYKCILRRPQ